MQMQVEAALLFETLDEMCARVFRSLRPRASMPRIETRFCRFADANSVVRLRDGVLDVRITDVLEGGPAPVLEALVCILLSKLYRRPVPAAYNQRYRRYMNRREMRRSLQLLRQARGRKFLSGAEGQHYHLDRVFEELNTQYFHGLMARPMLGWSRQPSRSMLGHYDPSHNAVIISRILDDPNLPRLGLEYVLFHEMLHLRYPVEHRYARRRVHTREFREAEKQFARFKEAKELLKTICAAARLRRAS